MRLFKDWNYEKSSLQLNGLVLAKKIPSLTRGSFDMRKNAKDSIDSIVILSLLRMKHPVVKL